MANSKEYAQLVARAEQAVVAVKDPELRRVAFQKVLEDLLAGGGSESQDLGQQRSPKASRQRVAGGGSRRGSSRRGTQAYIAELLEEGFFKKPRTIAHLKAELENRGHHIPLTSLSGPLQRMTQKRQLRRQKMKASGNKHTFGYSNW